MCKTFMCKMFYYNTFWTYKLPILFNCHIVDVWYLITITLFHNFMHYCMYLGTTLLYLAVITAMIIVYYSIKVVDLSFFIITEQINPDHKQYNLYRLTLICESWKKSKRGAVERIFFGKNIQSENWHIFLFSAVYILSYSHMPF